jgi:hypothetical protein
MPARCDPPNCDAFIIDANRQYVVTGTDALIVG